MRKISFFKLPRKTRHQIALSFLGISTIFGCKIQATQFGNTQGRNSKSAAEVAKNSASMTRPAMKTEDFNGMKNYLNTKGTESVQNTLQKSIDEIYNIDLIVEKNLTDIDFFGHKIDNLAQWLPGLKEYYSDIARSNSTFESYLARFEGDTAAASIGNLPSDEDLAFLVDLINQGPEAIEQLDRMASEDAEGLYLGSAKECVNAILGAVGDVANMTIGCTGVAGVVGAADEGIVAGAKAAGKAGVGAAAGSGEKITEGKDANHDPYYDAARAVPCVGGVVGAPKSIGHAIGENGCGRHTHRHHSKPGEKKTLTEIFTE